MAAAVAVIALAFGVVQAQAYQARSAGPNGTAAAPTLRTVSPAEGQTVQGAVRWEVEVTGGLGGEVCCYMACL